jgi:hypothetical protein
MAELAGGEIIPINHQLSTINRLRGFAARKRPSDSVAGETPAATREDACAPRNCATATSTYGARASMVCEAKNAELPEAR